MYAALDWCCEHMADGDTLSVWTSLKSNPRSGSKLEQLVSGRRNVEYVLGKGGGFILSEAESGRDCAP